MTDAVGPSETPVLEPCDLAFHQTIKAANTLLRTHGTSTKTHGVTADSKDCALLSVALGTPRPDHEDGTLGSVFKGARGRH